MTDLRIEQTFTFYLNLLEYEDQLPSFHYELKVGDALSAFNRLFWFRGDKLLEFVQQSLTLLLEKKLETIVTLPDLNEELLLDLHQRNDRIYWKVVYYKKDAEGGFLHYEIEQILGEEAILILVQQLEDLYTFLESSISPDQKLS